MNKENRNLWILRISIIFLAIGLVLESFVIIKQYMTKEKEQALPENAVYKEEVKSITIRYNPFYDVDSLELMNEATDGGYAEIYEIKLEGKELKEIASLVNKVEKMENECDCDVMSEVELVINENYSMILNGSLGLAGKKGEKKVMVTPTELSKAVDKILSENNKKIMKTVDSPISTIEKDEIYTLPEEVKNSVKGKLNYMKVNIDRDPITYDDILYKVTYDDGTKAMIYAYSILGYIELPDGEKFFAAISTSNEHVDSYEHMIGEIYGVPKKDSFKLTGGLKEGEACADAIEPLYVDGKKVCEFNCMMSGAYQVEFEDGKVLSVKEALEKKLVTIEELQKQGLPCH